TQPDARGAVDHPVRRPFAVALRRPAVAVRGIRGGRGHNRRVSSPRRPAAPRSGAPRAGAPRPRAPRSGQRAPSRRPGAPRASATRPASRAPGAAATGSTTGRLDRRAGAQHQPARRLVTVRSLVLLVVVGFAFSL